MFLDEFQGFAVAGVTEAISAASCAVAELVDAQAIVSTTMSGYTARQIARHRPITRIIAVTPNAHTQRTLALVWGVESFITDQVFDNTVDLLGETVTVLEDSLDEGVAEALQAWIGDHGDDLGISL